MANKLNVQFIGDGALRKKLSNMEEKMLTRKLMKKLSLQAITEIFETTVEEGKDKTGKSFKLYKPYSPSYLDIKEKRGGRFFSSKPNLFDKGAMLGSLDHKVISESSAFLHFPKIKERLKASGHIHGSKILPQRDFFGLTRKGEKVLVGIVDDHIGDLTDA